MFSYSRLVQSRFCVGKMSSGAGNIHNASHNNGDSSETETTEQEPLTMSATAQASNNLLLCDVILKDLQALHDRLKERDLVDAPLPLQK